MPDLTGFYAILAVVGVCVLVLLAVFLWQSFHQPDEEEK
jgi:hypothetical protein